MRSNAEQNSSQSVDDVRSDSTRLSEDVGIRLRSTIGRVLHEVPGCSLRPTDIARELDVSRVMVSRVLSSIARANAEETLTSIPGPETLRSIVRAAEVSGVPASDAKLALTAIDDFDELIRDQYGTRAALNAALSSENSVAREKFELSSRYQVFKGMSQVLGVESKIWLTSMMLTPSKSDEHVIDVSTIHGTSGLRRLRPDMPIRFTYGIPPKYKESRQSPERKDKGLARFFSHTPAPLTSVVENGQIINTFAPEIGGKDALYDMLAEVHTPGGSNRFAAPGRTRRGTSVIPDVPVMTLVSDVIMHGDIFEGIEPELIVFNTMSRGGADIDDPARDVDRVTTNDTVIKLGNGLDNLEISEFPRYTDMMSYLCDHNGYKLEEFRTHRLQVQYPIYGFQYVIAYKVPPVEGS